MRQIIFLTGYPGIGKTTVIKKVVESLKSAGLNIGGFISYEVREKGRRVGFRILDLKTGQEGWLAHIKQPVGPRISKYKVNLKDLENVGVKSLENAIKQADLIVIDEIGPMELFSGSFRIAVKKAIESDKAILGTIHYRARDPLIKMIKNCKDINIMEVTVANRNDLPKRILEKFLSLLSISN